MRTEKKPPKPKPEQFDADGVALIERPKHLARLLNLLGDREAITVGARGDPRRIRVMLVKVTP